MTRDPELEEMTQKAHDRMFQVHRLMNQIEAQQELVKQTKAALSEHNLARVRELLDAMAGDDGEII